MKTIKKRIALLTAALLVFSLCACGNSTTAAAASSDTTTVSAQTTAFSGDESKAPAENGFPGQPPEGTPPGDPPDGFGGGPGGTPPGDPPEGFDGGPGGTPPGDPPEGFGGGTVTVDGGTYTSNGLGSPAICSTADITVSNATLTSNLSEGVCIEGLNSITLNDCELTANNTQCNSNATFHDTIMIYQSMSGDAANGTSHFTMTGGSLTSKSGHVFHVTNTNAVITLEGVKIVNEDADDILLSVCADGWSGGSNIAELKAVKQQLSGAVKVGSDSSLTLTLTDGSTFAGSIDGSIVNAKGETVSTEVGTVSVTLDATSTWTLTGDSYITAFSGSAANVISNGYTLYVGGTPLPGTK